MTSGLAVNYFLMYDLVVDMAADVFFQHRTRMLHLVVSKLLDVAMLDMTSEVANIELPRVVLGTLAEAPEESAARVPATAGTSEDMDGKVEGLAYDVP